MDPVACLNRIMSLLIVNDREGAAEALRDLADWLDRDGFVPYVESVERTYGDRADGTQRIRNVYRIG